MRCRPSAACTPNHGWSPWEERPDSDSSRCGPLSWRRAGANSVQLPAQEKDRSPYVVRREVDHKRVEPFDGDRARAIVTDDRPHLNDGRACVRHQVPVDGQRVAGDRSYDMLPGECRLPLALGGRLRHLRLLSPGTSRTSEGLLPEDSDARTVVPAGSCIQAERRSTANHGLCARGSQPGDPETGGSGTIRQCEFEGWVRQVDVRLAHAATP